MTQSNHHLFLCVIINTQFVYIHQISIRRPSYLIRNISVLLQTVVFTVALLYELLVCVGHTLHSISVSIR